MKTQDWVFGKTVVAHLLDNHLHLLEKIFIKQNHSLLPLIKQKTLPYQIWSTEQFKQQFGSQNHQFTAALVKRYQFYPWKSFLLDLQKTTQKKLILILDHIQDVHNFGTILRIASATKVDAVIVPNFNQAPISSATIKAAAGNVFNIKIIQVANLSETVVQLKKRHFWVFAALTDGVQRHYQVDFTNLNIVLIVGNEHRGIGSLLQKKVDYKIQIPMFGVESLNVSNATAILLYQIRQNQNFWKKLTSK